MKTCIHAGPLLEVEGKLDGNKKQAVVLCALDLKYATRVDCARCVKR